MSQKLAEIINPLVEKGLFENAETAVRNLMLNFVLQQIERNRTISQKFENKYGMPYFHFNKYLAERAKNLSLKSSAHKSFMLEEEDGLDWKIATEMLESWIGLKEKANYEPVA